MSGIIEAINNLRQRRFILDQVATTFFLGAINWALLVSGVGFITGTSSVSFASIVAPLARGNGVVAVILLILFVVGIAVFPLLTSISSTVAFPERILITPLDINTVAIGIFLVTAWYQSNSAYTSGAILAGFFLIMTGIYENPVARAFQGREIFPSVPNKQLYDSDSSIEKVLECLNQTSVRKNLGLTYSGTLSEDQKDVTIFDGEQGDYEFFIGIFPRLAKNGTQLWFFGYELAGRQVKPIEDFDDWVEGKIAVVNLALGRNIGTVFNQGMAFRKLAGAYGLPTAMFEYALKSHRGYLTRFGEAWRRNLRRSAIVIASIPALYVLHTDYGLPLDGFVGAFLIVLAWQFGPAALHLRRRLK